MKKTISVFYIGQDDLIELLATSICSVCHNTKSFVNFYVLDCGIGKLNKQYIENLKCKFDNFDINYLPVDLKIFDGLKKYKYSTKNIIIALVADTPNPVIKPNISIIT